MGVRNDHLPGHLVGGGVDGLDLAGAEPGHEDRAAVRCDRQAVRGLTHLDTRGDAIGVGVDHGHGRSAVTADVDPASVRGDNDAMRTRRHRNGGEDLVAGRVEDGDGVVFEQTNIRLWRGGLRGGNRAVGKRIGARASQKQRAHGRETPAPREEGRKS